MLNINKQIKLNEISKDEWEYVSIARKAHRWIDLMIADFFDGMLPTPYLTFKKSRINSFGHFNNALNEVAASNEVNLNVKHLDRSELEIASTILHQLCHLWQRMHGTPGKHYYHNFEFQTKTLQLGIPSNVKGVTQELRNPFLSWAKKNKIKGNPKDLKLVKKIKGKSKLKAWCCPKCNIKIRSGKKKELNIICGDCKELFVLEE